jgi:hypothetical protein
VATRDDRVYAFDADDTNPDPHTGLIWQRELWDSHHGAPGIGMHAAPLPGAEDGAAPCWQTRGPIGILGTPVIDPVKSIMYVVYRVGLPPDLNPADIPNHYAIEAHHFIVAIDLATGQDRIAPVEIAAPGFDPNLEMNRPGLLLQSGTVFVGFANPVCDHGGNPFQPFPGGRQIGGGWLLAYNAATLAPRGSFRTAPNAGGAGIWQSGNGVAGDGSSVYVFTGNNYDSDFVFRESTNPSDFGESILKFRLSSDALSLAGYYRANNWYKLDTGETVPPNNPVTFGDSDLGSAGPIVMPGGRLIGGGKQGYLYLLNTQSMSVVAQRQGFFNTWHQDSSRPPCPVDPKGFTANCYLASGRYDESQQYGPNIHADPVVWVPPGTATGHLYAMPEKDYLRSYEVSATAITPTAVTTQAQGIRSPDGMPGASLALSSNGATNGIVWASYVADNDATDCPQYGDLRAFDATDLQQIWKAGDPHIYSKFTPVTIADGKVFRPTFGNEVAIYGLGAQPQPPLAQFGSLAPGAPVTPVWSNLNHLDLFAVAKNGAVTSSYLESDRQSDWFSIGPAAKFSPAERVTAVWSNPQHLDLFAAGSDGHVYSTWWEFAKGWQPWFAIQPASATLSPLEPVTAVWSNPQHLDLFVTDASGTVRSTWWEGPKGWQPWFSIGPPGLTKPGQPITAVWSNPAHLDLFAVNRAGAIISTYWEAASGWKPWFTIEPATGHAVSGQRITALWSNPGHLDLFASSADGHVISTYWEAAGGYVPWFAIQPADMQVKPGTSIAARWAIWPGPAAPQLDLFTIDRNGNVQSSFWTAKTAWVHWFVMSQPSMHGVAGAAAEALYSQPGPVNGNQWPRLEVFMTDANGEVARARFDRSGCGWQPFIEM